MSISVIIAIKNRADLISETLNSILNQSLPPDEIILVDDGSTDALQEVLKPYGTSVDCIPNDGKGPGAARNTGLKYARGEFIQFFDSDDIMSINKMEVQSALLNAHTSSGFVYGPYVTARYTAQRWEQTDVIMQYFPLPQRPLPHLVAEGWCGILPSCLFTKTLLDKVGPWREDLMTHEDKEYWFRIGKLAPSPIHENQSITIYRQHENQITDKLTSTLSRTQNGIHAFEEILHQSNTNHVPFLSKSVLKGMIVQYKKYMNQHGSDYSISMADQIYALITKVYSKVGRLSTGTDWQPMHGVHASEERYRQYLSLIK